MLHFFHENPDIAKWNEVAHATVCIYRNRTLYRFLHYYLTQTEMHCYGNTVNALVLLWTSKKLPLNAKLAI